MMPLNAPSVAAGPLSTCTVRTAVPRLMSFKSVALFVANSEPNTRFLPLATKPAVAPHVTAAPRSTVLSVPNAAKPPLSDHCT